MFAEVILPLPLQATYTYRIPDELATDVAAGSRVIVQFGKKRYYTGVVAAKTPVEPKVEYELKEIMSLLDPEPVTTRMQLRLWQWVADYYLCSIGDVMKAAIPAGLKPESETKLRLNPQWERDDTPINERQAAIVVLMTSEGPLKLEEITSKSKMKDAVAIVNELLDLGVLEVCESMVERYRPKKETFVNITIERDDNLRLHDAMEIVARAPRQEKLLMAWLELSGWLRRDADPKPVSRQALLEKAGVTAASLKGLVEKGILEIYKKTVNRFAGETGSVSPLSPLSDPQHKTLLEINASMRENAVTLLHGVTGSGKTEIYTHLIQTVLNQGKSVLFLVPEISLTTQLTDRLRRFFGNKLLVYHSKFSDNERVDIYRRVASRAEGPLIVLGVRSSVFLPIDNLGLVIVDEEHETSFKQYDPAPRYNARDVAIVLASMCGAKVLLGSATPSIETYYKATSGKFGLVSLTERFGGAVLPRVEVVDMRAARKRKEVVGGMLSSHLRLATLDVLQAGKQAIMFQNRRGFAPVVICHTCGWSPKCPNCDVSLVYHKYTDSLRCHYCGYSRQLPVVCPSCGLRDVEVYGFGTERIAEVMHKLFDGYRVARMDLDTTRNRQSQQEIIEEFADRQTDILVGTQMVTKGLDFAGVELVGVINADSLLTFPDFRANERAFNMLEQVSGRAGRRNDSGKVVIQTSRPDEKILEFVVRHDYHGYYNSEIDARRQYGYPPFSRIINIILKNKEQQKVDGAANLLASALRGVFGQRVLGPEKPFVSRVNTWYLQSIMIKVESDASMKRVKEILRHVYLSVARDSMFKGTMINYDVDPA